MRRGAAWPAERPSSCLVVREAVSRWQVASPPSLMAAGRCRRRPQEHGWGPSGRALGVVAQEVRMPAVPSSPCRRPRPASGVHCLVRMSSVTRACPRGPLSGVRCGCPGVQMSGVRSCPVSVGFRVRWVRPRGRGARRWAGSRMAGMAGSAWSPAVPRPVRRLPGSEPGGWARHRPCWASGGVGFDLAVVGAVVGRGQVDRVGDQDRLDVGGPLVASRGARRGSDYPAWSSCEA